MLERKYDPTRPYRYVRYGRMSDPKQNKRSPDQQFNTIDETIARCGYPWQHVASYRDDGISGRYLRKRHDFQRLLRDIETGLIQVDLIVVDTLERLGRAEEISDLRRKLLIEYGVLVVAADTGFSDPTGIVGKAIGMVEQMRSTENTRISRHNVIRGKKDAARLGRWPGGPSPFGFKLKPVIDNSISPPGVFNVLELEPRAATAMRLAFERAVVTGEGDLRLSQWWNANPEIPVEFKPVSPFTTGYRLENPIAIGTLRWGANRTGVINDSRVVEPNPDGVELIPNFCTPLVSVELYERVLKLRRARSENIKAARKVKDAHPNNSTKLIAPQARGLTLKYLLTGLARCGCCNASMRPLPSGRKSKAGRRYVYYTCPRHYDGACGNGRHVPEDRLREAVIARLRTRLFPLPCPAGDAPLWLPELLEMVRHEQQRFQVDEPDRPAAVKEELRQLDQQLTGWSLTLGNPNLPATVRTDIEDRYARAKLRQQELQQSLDDRKAVDEHRGRAFDPKAVIAALHQLGDVLARHNPTLGNLELSKHIDVITCYPDGRVEMRGTRPGVFEGGVELLSVGDGQAESSLTSGYAPVIPRRRGRLRVPSLSAAGNSLNMDMRPTVSPKQSADWSGPFSWGEPTALTEKLSWSEQHAAQVAQGRASGKTHEELAAHFAVSVPTIRKALRIAAKDAGSLTLPRKMPRPRWPEHHFQEVAKMAGQGMSLKELCQHFQRSEPLIRKALQLANEHAQHENG